MPLSDTLCQSRTLEFRVTYGNLVVLVLEVERVLPDVNADEGNGTYSVRGTQPSVQTFILWHKAICIPRTGSWLAVVATSTRLFFGL